MVTSNFPSHYQGGPIYHYVIKGSHYSHRVIKETHISSLWTKHCPSMWNTELSKDPDMYESLNSKFDLANYKFSKYTMYICTD